MKKVISGAPLTVALISTSAVAADTSGLYIGADIGKSNSTVSSLEQRNLDPVGHSVTSQDAGTSKTMFLGYKFNPIFSLEATYSQFADTSLNQMKKLPTSTTSRNSTIETWSSALVAKVSYPVTKVLSVYAVGGAQYYNVKRHTTGDYTQSSPIGDYTQSYSEHDTDSGIGAHYGAGMEFMLPANLSIRLQYTVTDIDSTDMNNASIGLTYLF